MFNKKDHSFFFAAIVALTIGFTAMAVDPVDNGFGMLTLWVAPPLLLLGFILPITGIVGIENLKLSGNWQEPTIAYGQTCFRVCCLRDLIDDLSSNTGAYRKLVGLF